MAATRLLKQQPTGWEPTPPSWGASTSTLPRGNAAPCLPHADKQYKEQHWQPPHEPLPHRLTLTGSAALCTSGRTAAYAVPRASAAAPSTCTGSNRQQVPAPNKQDQHSPPPPAVPEAILVMTQGAAVAWTVYQCMAAGAADR